jgi:hypothetical protein
LVKAPGQRPFIATMPAPGTYAVSSDGCEDEISPTDTDAAIAEIHPELSSDSLDQLERLWESNPDDFPDDEA